MESATLDKGVMIWVSAEATNAGYLTENPPYLALIQNSTGYIKRGSTIADCNVEVTFTPTYTGGDKLKIVRDGSNALRIYYNATLIHNFGVVAGDLYCHISQQAVSKTVSAPEVV